MEVHKSVDEIFFGDLELPITVIESLKTVQNENIVKGFETVSVYSDEFETINCDYIPFGMSLKEPEKEETEIKGFEGDNTELDEFLPPLISAKEGNVN